MRRRRARPTPLRSSRSLTASSQAFFSLAHLAIIDEPPLRLPALPELLLARVRKKWHHELIKMAGRLWAIA